MLRRRGIMTQNSELPGGYKKCVYLESSGTQYINTKIQPSSETKIYACWSILNVNRSQYIMGSRNEWAKLINIAISGSVSSDTFYDVYRGETTPIEYRIKRNNTDIFRSCIDGNGTDAFCYLENMNDGTYKECTIHSTAELESNTPLYIFAFNPSNVHDGCRIYESKVWISGELAFNGIPALDPSGAPCMYDTVTKQPFYNQGTGKFNYVLA